MRTAVQRNPMPDRVVLQNEHLARTVSLDHGRLGTLTLLNKATGHAFVAHGDEFLVELDGPAGPRLDLGFGQTMDPLHAPDPAGLVITAEDCRVLEHQLARHLDSQTLRVALLHPPSGLRLDVVYVLGDADPYLRKHLELPATARAPLVTRLEVERLCLDPPVPFDQPGFMPGPQAVGNWYGELRLGQPLLGEELFFGLEHPAGYNRVEGGAVILRHFPGRRLDHPLTSKTAVTGVARRGEVCRAFREYLLTVVTPAVRERRLILGAHSWNATDVNPTESRVTGFAEALLGGLARHDLTLDYLEIDCGWAHPRTLWEVDARKFPQGLGPVVEAVKRHGARLGLWYSPAGVWALDPNPSLGLEREVATEGVGKGSYCIAGPHHHQALLEVMQRHLREHDLRVVIFDFFSGMCGAADHGHLPHRPYALEAMLDAHFELIAALRRQQPDLWVVDWETPTFAFSPWLLMHVDSVWLAWSDAAMATGTPTPLPQSSWMTTARDAMTFRETRWLSSHGRHLPEPFPAWATDRFVFNDLHEPAHEVGRPAYYGNRTDNLMMGLCRGGLTWIWWPLPEYYHDGDYAFFASAFHWAKARHGVLAEMRPLLGDPEQRGAYAYGHCGQGGGVLAVRNPFVRGERFEIPLDERLGIETGDPHEYLARVVYPFHGFLDAPYRRGDRVAGDLPGYQTRIIELLPRAALPGPVPLGVRAVTGEEGWRLWGVAGSRRFVDLLYPDGRREEHEVVFPGQADLLQVPVARLLKAGEGVLAVLELTVPTSYQDTMLLVLCQSEGEEPVCCQVSHYDDQPGLLARPLVERSPRDATTMGLPYNMAVPNWIFFSTALGGGRHRLNVSLTCVERQGWAQGQWSRPLRGWVSVWLWTRQPLAEAHLPLPGSRSLPGPAPMPLVQDLDQQLVALIPETYVNTRAVSRQTIVSL
jgi:hypothetical protein